MPTDDTLQFGAVVVLAVAVDLLTRGVAVQEATSSLITAPALAIGTAFARSATAASWSLGPFAPWLVALSATLSLYLLSRWRWSGA
jgi:2-methylaconitate cis-trans-isomerase PrpF